MNTRVSIISVNFNQEQFTLNMIKSVRDHVSEEVEIIIVDNGDKKMNQEKLSSLDADCIYVATDKNLGFAGANNLGYKYANGKYIFLLNNDIEVEHDFLSPLVKLLDEKDSVGAVSPLIRFHENRSVQFAGYSPLSTITIRGGSYQMEGQKREKTNYLHGAAMMVKREVIEKIGLMSEEYFLYYEELDWCERMKIAGYELWFEPASEVLHHASVSTGKASPLKLHYMMRNRILFAKKFRKGLQKLLALGYLYFVAFPKDYIKNIQSKDHRSALVRAIKFHF
jgi:GT2 family glycosyltransferase